MMQYSSMSIHFLWIAYILVFVAQVSFAAWLVARWRQTSRELRKPARTSSPIHGTGR